MSTAVIATPSCSAAWVEPFHIGVEVVTSERERSVIYKGLQGFCRSEDIFGSRQAATPTPAAGSGTARMPTSDARVATNIADCASPDVGRGQYSVPGKPLIRCPLSTR